MELGEKRIDLLSILSMIELEAASGDEMEAYLFQEGDKSTIFQAGGKEHRNWKSKFETSGATSLHSAGSSNSSSESCERSTSYDPRNCNSSEISEIISGLDLSMGTCYPSSSSNSEEFYTFSRDKSPTPGQGAVSENNGYQDFHRGMPLEIEEDVKAATLEKSPSYFHKEIGSIISAQIKVAESHARQARRSTEEKLGQKSASNHDNSAFVPEAHPIQAIQVSLGRWIDFLENHDASASYKDLVQLHSFAKRFMNLVEFFFLTLVDILLKRSHLFDTLLLDTEEGVLFPPLSSIIEGAAGDDEREPQESHESSTSADHRSRSNKSELRRLQEWLMDGIDYLGSQEIVAYYEDYQLLHATAKQLLELLEAYFKNLVDRLLKQCAALEGEFVHEPVLIKFSERTRNREDP